MSIAGEMWRERVGLRFIECPTMYNLCYILATFSHKYQLPIVLQRDPFLERVKSSPREIGKVCRGIDGLAGCDIALSAAL